MDLKKAKVVLGDRATWELQNMKRALEGLTFLRTDEDEERLEAVEVMLKARRGKADRHRETGVWN